MDFSAIKDLYIGSTPVQSAWLNGSKVWGRKPAVDEQSIRDAMILWYDLKKQGATNESMAENPVLRDLSGNGHDATCYNFAWSGMSGIGGFQISGSMLSPDGIFVVPSNSYANTAASNMTDKDVIVTFEVTGNEGKWLKAMNMQGFPGAIERGVVCLPSDRRKNPPVAFQGRKPTLILTLS